MHDPSRALLAHHWLSQPSTSELMVQLKCIDCGLEVGLHCRWEPDSHQGSFRGARRLFSVHVSHLTCTLITIIIIITDHWQHVKNMRRSSEIYAQDDKLINICLNRCIFLPPVFIIDQTWRENPTEYSRLSDLALLSWSHACCIFFTCCFVSSKLV